MSRARFSTALALVIFALFTARATTAQATPASFDSADGKWYQPVLVPTGITWGAAESAAQAAGGYLACPTDSAQNTFVFNLISAPSYWTALSVNSDFLGPWLGATSTNDTNGSDATWTWVNGAPFSYNNWYSNQPDGFPGDLPLQAIDYYDFASIGPTWGDTAQSGTPGFDLPQGYVIEFNTNPNPTSTAVPLPSAAWSGLALLAGLVIFSTIKSRLLTKKSSNISSLPAQLPITPAPAKIRIRRPF
ncbi:MAG: hypothetical protein ABSF29_04360 [Tepidisphaeraceae bacterium]